MNLGWISPSERTEEQTAAHYAAIAGMPKFALPGTARELAKGEKLRLTDAWKAPEVVADVGFVFPRFHQLTGSCVGAGGGQALFTLIAIQRLLATNPTKAILPWWPYNYGQSRLLGGMRGPGQGSFGSTFAQSVTNGILPANYNGLPKYETQDGLVISESLEMEWSDGGSVDRQLVEAAKAYPVGSAAELKSVEDVKKSILNGYPVTFACSRYIGNASIQGEGEDACVIGHWDTSGGHQQSIHDYWEHPRFGPLYWAQNNWPKSVYPIDPSGGPVCGCWVLEDRVEEAMHYEGEIFAFSHLSYFPAQPKVLDLWLI